MALDTSWLQKIAPMVGTALLGPFGGIAASMIADRMGVNASEVSKIVGALNSGQMTPDQLTAIKNAEIEFSKFMETNRITEKQLELADVANARGMQMAVRSRMPAILTMFVTFGFFGILAYLLYLANELPAGKELNIPAPILIMLGSLGTGWTTACSFWLGTTSSSQNKTELIARAEALK
jgi:hypothetical protein